MSKRISEQPILIQDRGSVLCLDQASERTVAVSENAHEVFGLASIDDVLDQGVVDILGREVTHALRNAESLPFLDRRRQWLGYYDVNDRRSFVSVFASAGFLVIDIVPFTGDRDPSANEVLNDVRVFSDVIVSSVSSEALVEQLAALLKTISGFHCVAVDQICEGSFEHVSAVGQQNLSRARCESSPNFCSVMDVNRPVVQMRSAGSAAIPDLGLSILRLPSDDVLNDLRHHGVTAFFSVPLFCGPAPWGCLKLLHGTPRLLNRRTQFALAHLAPLVSQRLLQLQ